MGVTSSPLTLACLTLLTIHFFSTQSHQANYTANTFTSPIPNPRLLKAYTALQAFKYAIKYDPNGITKNWYGFDVCSYTGVYCAPAPDEPYLTTVAGIDLNHYDLVGYLPLELGLLNDLALFHLNSNKFFGTIPWTFKKLCILHELDISNNEFSGVFPLVLLEMTSLRFIDIRFNKFIGKVPSKLFELNLDALFINNNKFTSNLPDNIGNSPVSVIVLANNDFNDCFPKTISQMSNTLTQILLINSGLKGCLPKDIGKLNKVTVFDVSSNDLTGPLPESMGQMESLEQLNIAHNKFSGKIPTSICALKSLQNFTYSDNYLCEEPQLCLKLEAKDDKRNCLPYRPVQRSVLECKVFYANPIGCGGCGCGVTAPSTHPTIKTCAPPPPPYFHFPWP